MMDQLHISVYFMASYNMPQADTTHKHHGFEGDGKPYHILELEKRVKFTDKMKYSWNKVFNMDGGVNGATPAGVYHMSEALWQFW